MKRKHGPGYLPGDVWMTKTCWTRIKRMTGWVCMSFYTWNMIYHAYFFTCNFVLKFAFTELSPLFATCFIAVCSAIFFRNVWLYFTCSFYNKNDIKSLKLRKTDLNK